MLVDSPVNKNKKKRDINYHWVGRELECTYTESKINKGKILPVNK